MRKRTIVLISLLIVSVLMLSFVFAACKDSEKDKVDNSDVTEPTAQRESITSVQAFKKMLNAVPEGKFASFEWLADVTVDSATYNVSLKGNVGKEEYETVFAISGGDVDLRLYIIDGGIYYYDGTTVYYFSDIDADYIQQILVKGYDKLDEVLSDIDIVNTLGGLDAIIEMVVGLIAPGKVAVNTDGNTQSFTIGIIPSSLVNIVDLLGSVVNLDSIMIGNQSLTQLLNKIFAIVGDTQIDVHASITSGVLSSLSAEVTKSGSELISVTTSSLTFSADKKDYGIPAAIANAADMSITNLQFTAKLDVQGNQVDIGKLVNTFTGQKTLDEGLFIINADTALIADVAIDLDLNYDMQAGDNNYAAIELYNADKSRMLASVYYYDGALYIGALGNMSTNENIRFLKVPVNSLPDFIGSLVNMVTDAIDSSLGTEWTHGQSVAMNGAVVALNVDSEGKASAADNIYSVLSVLTNLLGMPGEFVTASDTRLDIDVNKALEEFNLVFGSVPDISAYGNINIGLDFAGGKLNALDIDYTNTDFNAQANFRLDNLTWGPQSQFSAGEDEDGNPVYIGIEDYILKNISNGQTISAGENLADIITSIVADASLDINVNDFVLAKGTYNIASMLTSLGVQGLGGLGLDMTLTDDLTFSLALQADIAYNPAENEDSIIRLDIVATQDVKLGEDVRFNAGDTIIGLLAYDGKLYIDLTNFRIAGISLGRYVAQVDVDELFVGLIEQLTQSVDLSGLKIDLPSLISDSRQSESASLRSSDYTLSATDALVIGIFEDKITADISIDTVFNLLRSFGIDFVIDGISADLNVNLSECNPVQLADEAKQKAAEFEGVSEDFVEAILSTVNDKKLSITMDMSSSATRTLFLGSVITALTGKEMDLDLNFGTFDTTMVIDLMYHLDMNTPAQNKLALEIRYGGKDNADNLLIGAYLFDNSLYADLRGVGFTALTLPGEQIVDKLLTMLNDLIYGGGKDGQAAVAKMSGEELAAAEAAYTVYQVNKAMGRNYETDGVYLNVTYDLAEALMYALGIDLDFNIDLSGSFELTEGTEINAQIYLDDIAKLNVAIGLTQVSSEDWSAKQSQVAADEGFVDVTQGDTRQMASDLIKALDLNLSIDIANHNNYSGGGTTYTRFKLETLKSPRTIKGETLGAGNMLLTIQEIDEAAYNGIGGSVTDLIYISIYTDNIGQGLRINMKEGNAVITATIIVEVYRADIADYIDVKIPTVDVLGIIASLLDGIYAPEASGESSGTGVSVMAESENSGGGILDGFNIADLFTGASLTLSPDNLQAKLNLDAYSVNKLIDSVLTGFLFGKNTAVNVAEIDLGFGTGVVKDSYLAWVEYNRTLSAFKSTIEDAIVHDAQNGTYGFLGDIIIKETESVPVLGTGAWGLVKGTAISSGKKIADWLYNVLSFPVFNEVELSVNVQNGKLSTVELYGVNNGQAVTDSEGSVLSADLSTKKQGTVYDKTVRYDESVMAPLAGSYTRITITNNSSGVTGNGSVGSDGGWLIDWKGLSDRVIYNPYVYSGADEAADELIKDFPSDLRVAAHKTQTYKRASSVTYTYNGAAFDRSVLRGLLDAPGDYTVVATATFADGATTTKDITLSVRDVNGDWAVSTVETVVYQGITPSYIDVTYVSGVSERLSTDDASFEYNQEGNAITSVTLANGMKIECNISVIGIQSVTADGNTGKIVFNPYELYNYVQGMETSLPSQADVVYSDGYKTVLPVDWRVDELAEAGKIGTQFTVTHKIGLGNTLYNFDITVLRADAVQVYTDKDLTGTTVASEGELPKVLYVNTATGATQLPAVWIDLRASDGYAIAVTGYDVAEYAATGRYVAVKGFESLFTTYQLKVA